MQQMNLILLYYQFNEPHATLFKIVNVVKIVSNLKENSTLYNKYMYISSLMIFIKPQLLFATLNVNHTCFYSSCLLISSSEYGQNYNVASQKT